MSLDEQRRAELVAAALAGDLTEPEQRELDQARLDDPTLKDELNDLGALARAVSDAGVTWREEQPPADLRERVSGIAESEAQDRAADPTPVELGQHRERSGRTLTRVAAAVGLVAAGAVGAVTVQTWLDAPPEGPPGTLGAVEPITFSGAPAEAEIDASLVAHTWGTETVLEIDGLALGEVFEVVLVASDGTELRSGTFIGTQETVVCRMNAAVLREDVVQVRLESADDTVNAVADLPPVP